MSTFARERSRSRRATRPAALLAGAVAVAALVATGTGPRVQRALAATPTVWDASDVRLNGPSPFGGQDVGLREPVLAVDPADPSIVVAAAIDDNYSNTHTFGSWAGAIRFYRSADGGHTWVDRGLFRGPGGPDVWTTGDPTMVFDANGRLWIAMLADVIGQTDGPLGVQFSQRGGIEVYRSDDAGLTWSGPFQAVQRHIDEVNHVCVAPDKELLTIDPRTGELVMAYTQFANTCPRDQVAATVSQVAGNTGISIVLVRSSDGGATWTAPVELYRGYAVGAAPAVGPDGTIFVAFSSTDPYATPGACPAWQGLVVEGQPRQFDLVIASSSDGGVSWRYDRRATCNPELLPSESTAIGDRLPSMSVDPSTGRAVVVWGSFTIDALTGQAGYTVQATTSTDGGHTWSVSVPVSGADGRDHLTPSVVARSGRVNVIWVAGARDGSQFDYLTAESLDGGVTWSAPQPLATAPSAAGDISDYFWVDAQAGRIAAIWTDTRSGLGDIYVRTGIAGS